MIIWNETPVNHEPAIEELNWTMQDLKESMSVMGEMTSVLANDFKQTRPVILWGTIVH